MPVYPQPNLGPNSAPWGRAVDKRLLDLETLVARKSLEDVNTNKQQNSTINSINRQITVIAQTAATANEAAANASAAASQAGEAAAQANTAVTRLNGIAQSWYNESTTGVSTTGFSTSGSRPSSNVSSPTGRIEVTFGGSLNSGQGYFLLTVVRNDTGAVIVDRAAMLQNPAQRIAIAGGASFAPSGYRSQIFNVPTNVSCLVRLEYYGDSTDTYFFGGSLLVKVSP